MDPEEETIDVRRYVGIFLSRWWLLVLLTAAGGLVAYYNSDRQDRVYQARATILVQYRGPALTVGISDFGASERLASTYQWLVMARPF